MTISTTQISRNAYSKFAGLLYLLIAIVGGWSIGYMPSLIVDTDSAAATTKNIIEHYDILRLGIAGDIFVLLLEVVLTVLIFRIFKHVNRAFALVATFSRLAMAIVMGLNLLNYLIPIMLVKDASLFAGFQPEQINSLMLLFLKTHKYGEFVWQVFFSLHLFVLGYLVIKSGYVLRCIGYLMLIGSFGYASQSICELLFLEGQVLSIANGILLAIATIGELIFTFWLLIKGINEEADK